MLINEFVLKDGITIQMFQGNRGVRPDLDFRIKQSEPGKRSRTPTHTHWIVDLLLKMEHDKDGVKDFIIFLIDIYNKSTPFKNKKERKNYVLKYTKRANKKFSQIKGGVHSVEYITAVVELFSICEKQFPGAYMFKGCLDLALAYSKGTKDFFRIIGHTKRV